MNASPVRPFTGPELAANQPGLARLLAPSSWQFRVAPFPHFRVPNVFQDSVYRQLEAAFRKMLPSETSAPDPARGLLHGGDYFDGYLVPLKHSLTGPLTLFISRPWRDLLSAATGVRVTHDVNAALHLHPANSSDGFIHKDFSACWFAERPRADGINVAANGLCDYRTGRTTIEGTVVRERVRGVTMLFYINNPAWTSGDGGETGLYRSAKDDVADPAEVIPPLNNSMLLFECSPTSFHAFISNRRSPRSSIALWLHRTKEDAVARWGANSVLYVKTK